MAHTILDGERQVAHGQRGVIAGKDVQAVDGREACLVLEQHIHIVVVVGHMAVEALDAARSYGGKVDDNLTIEPYPHRQVSVQRSAIVGRAGNGKGDGAIGRAAIKGKGRVGRAGWSHSGSCIVHEEDSGSLLVIGEFLDQGRAGIIGVDGIKARALLCHGHPQEATADGLITHTLHIQRGDNVE